MYLKTLFDIFFYVNRIGFVSFRTFILLLKCIKLAYIKIIKHIHSMFILNTINNMHVCKASFQYNPTL